jgi:hypothetical protein
MRKPLTEKQLDIARDRISEIKAKLKDAGSKPFMIRLALANDEDPDQAIWEHVIPFFISDYSVVNTIVDEYLDVTISRRDG